MQFVVHHREITCDSLSWTPFNNWNTQLDLSQTPIRWVGFKHHIFKAYVNAWCLMILHYEVHKGLLRRQGSQGFRYRMLKSLFQCTSAAKRLIWGSWQNMLFWLKWYWQLKLQYAYLCSKYIFLIWQFVFKNSWRSEDYSTKGPFAPLALARLWKLIF